MRLDKTALHIAAIAALSIIIMARELLTQSIFTCQVNDLMYYVNWTRQFAESLKDGIWYPRWMPVSNAGYGNPVFVFYPPFTVLITALAYILGGDMVVSVTAVKLAGLFLSGTFMYLFAKELWGWKGGLAASFVYMALPLRILDLYFTGIFASKFAYVWFPLILYFTRRAVKEERMGADVASLAVLYALLCVTHLISAYMILPVLLGFAAVSANRGKLFRSLARASSGCLLGLLISAFYILPALSEQHFVHFEELSNKWWLQYWNTYPFYIFSPEPPEPLNFNHYLAKVILATVLFGASLYLLPRRYANGGRKPEPLYFIMVVACSLFLMSSLSWFLWATVPGLHLLQFPMRWTSMMVLGVACLAGSVAGPLFDNGIDFRKSLAVISCAVIAVASLLVFYFDADIIRNSCHTDRQEVNGIPADFDVEEYVPEKTSLAWLKAEREKPPSEKVTALSGGKVDKLEVVKWRPEERLFAVEADEDAVLRISTFYYPGWHAFVDGQDVPLKTEEVSGAMLMNIPKGRHEIRLRFLNTLPRRIAFLISVLAALQAVYLFVWRRLRARVSKCCARGR